MLFKQFKFMLIFFHYFSTVLKKKILGLYQKTNYLKWYEHF